MKIVVLDGRTLNPGDNPWTPLEQFGAALEVWDRTPSGAVVERAREARILLTNKTHLRAEHLAALPNVGFISVLATGYDVVDVVEARARGIPVSNVPEYGTDSVAQHTLALMLELANRVGLHDAAVHEGEWASSPDFCFWRTPPVELAGRTLGVVGLGRIGRRVADLAMALGMRVLASGSPRSHETPERDISWTDLADLFARADVVSLHCPATPDTTRLVGASLLARMKPDAFLINTARGSLVDEPALAEALNAGRIAGAAMDVVSAEPIHPDNPLLAARNCILTPHVAWASLAARRRLMETTIRNVEAFLTGQPINVVNP